MRAESPRWRSDGLSSAAAMSSRWQKSDVRIAQAGWPGSLVRLAVEEFREPLDDRIDEGLADR